MADRPNQPLTRAEYAAALTELDEMMERVDTSAWGSDYTDGDRRVESAVLTLAEAVLAVAKGVRLLAEPPPVETVAAPGGFDLVLTDEERAEDEQSRPPTQRGTT